MITREQIETTIKNLEEANKQYEMMIWGNSISIGAFKRELENLDE